MVIKKKKRGMAKIDITNEDNMKLMARYEDNHFDLAIVDPPYGLGNKTVGSDKVDLTNKNSQQKFTRHQWDDEIPINEYFDELFRVSKRQIIWGGNYFPYIWKNGCRGLITWDKMVYIPTMSQIEYAWYSEDKLPKLVKINNTDKDRLHPTQKPFKLYEWLLMNYAKEGDKILDTHLGSGSIALACHNLGYDLTACELDKEYFDAAMKRIKNHQAQLTMF
jgi:site-specific DNA-methyltransferase (adenine-specific)